MTREQLRAEIEQGITKLLALPNFVVSVQQKQLLNAMQTFWSRDDGTNLDRVLALLPADPTPKE